MRFMNWQHFNLPFVFSKLALSDPPKVSSGETRNAVDALDRPNMRLYDPSSLHFPDHNWANPNSHGELPTAGGYITAGLNMVVYDHQAMWNREKDCQPGPVREFFRRQYYDNKINHV